MRIGWIDLLINNFAFFSIHSRSFNIAEGSAIVDQSPRHQFGLFPGDFERR